MKKTICLICKGMDTYQLLKAQLMDFFEPEVSIIGCALDGKPSKFQGGDMALITSSDPDIYGPAIELLEPGIPVEVIERQFDPLRIEQLMRIPAGTRVYVINNLPGTCQEVIDTLKKANVDHLRYIPMYPGSTYKDSEIRYAVTLGYPPLFLPEGLTHVVDVGIRLIHLNTLLSAAKKVGLSEKRSGRGFWCHQGYRGH
ncbi:MAG: hypothetical protein AB1420_14010 [Bacillota bacterium]